MSVSNITFNFTCKLKQNTSFDTGSNLTLQRFLNYRNQGPTPCDDNADHREQPARSRLSRFPGCVGCPGGDGGQVGSVPPV